MKSKNLKKIFNFLNINKKDLEGTDLIVYSDPYKSRKYNLKFPLMLNPAYIRVVSHFLGDGCLEKRGCRWYQKSDISGNNMIDLIFKLTNIKIKKCKKDSYGIPIVLGEIVGAALKLSRSNLKTPKVIEKVNLLPKEFKIQLLAALVVDEGHISKSCIKITNTNQKLLLSLRKLMVSLGYSCSNIKNYRNRIGGKIYIKDRYASVNYNIYDLCIHADGLLKFKEDLDNMIKKYGKIMGLWHKQDDLLKYSSIVDLDRIKKTRDSKKNIIPIIKKEIRIKPISIKKFAKKYNLGYIRAYKLFFRLKSRGEIKKISVGLFASNNYSGATNFTLRSKIEESLSKKPKGIYEIAKETGGGYKSVATQLSNLNKIGLIKKDKRGVYHI